MTTNWLDEIAGPELPLEALRDADPEKGEMLERAGALEPRKDRSGEVERLARECDAWEENQGVDRLAPVEVPEELRTPRSRRADNRRVGVRHDRLPWQRKAKGEDEFFEAQRAVDAPAARVDPVPHNELTKAFVEGAPKRELEAIGRRQERESAEQAELVAEMNATAGLEQRAQQLQEAIDVGTRLEQAPPVTSYVATELPRHVAQQELLKYAESAVREAAPQLPGYTDAIQYWNRHIEQRARAAGVTDPQAIAQQQEQVAMTLFSTAINNRVNPALLAYEAAKSAGFRAPTTLTSLSKASDKQFNADLKKLQVKAAGVQAELAEMRR